MRVFIGWDEREEEAAEVAARSLHRVTRGKIVGEFLKAPKLEAQGLLSRPVDLRGGQAYDIISNAPVSTAFANLRFLTPILCQRGPALFVDCDVVFHRDPREMLADLPEDAHKAYAVSVVKHEHHPVEPWKMVNQRQTSYPRKNWSSVMLFNCGHPANERLSLRDVNCRPGRALHAFYWLHDSEIGTLPPRWNWLVGVQPKPPMVGISHFTLGGPWLEGWSQAEHDDVWMEARDGL